MSPNTTRRRLVAFLDDIEAMLLRVSIKRWRRRYKHERALETIGRLPGMGGELGYRTPDTGGEA